MGVMASSSADDSAASRHAAPPPPPPSSSYRSSASSGTIFISSSASQDAEIKFEHKSQLPKLRSSSGSSSGSTSALQLADVGDLSDSEDSASAASTGSSSCSDGQVEIEPVTPQPSDWTAKDRCPYYPPRSDGCTEPRSCRDCLNVAVGGDYSCMVNQYGRCVQKNWGTYVKALDVKYQQPSNDGEVCEDQKVQFPAEEVNYCPYDDETCKKCKYEAFEDVMEGRINGSLTKFCYGETGCVCIAVCEAPIWVSTIGVTVCNGTVVSKDYESQHANTYGGSGDSADGRHKGQGIASLMMEIVGGVAAVVILIAAVMYARKQRRAGETGSSGSSSSSGSAEGGNTQEGGEDAAAGSVPMAVPVAPQLSLFGWQAMRSELIEREQLLLAGVEDFTNVMTGYLQLLDVDASAPPPEEDDSSAPVLLVPLAGASAPSFSPRGVAGLASAPSAPPASPSAPPASPSYMEEELL